LELVQALEALQASASTATASSSSQEEESLTTQYNLLVKLPENQSSPSPLTIQQISQQLRTAWSGSYAAVSEVSENILLATFLSNNAMMYVIRRQPWLIRRQNILIELYDPRQPLHAYKFDYLYLIPREARTPQRITSILNQIGHPSDLDEHIESNINRNEFYALTRAKINVNNLLWTKFLFLSPQLEESWFLSTTRKCREYVLFVLASFIIQ
jgi:hypothetical protein